MCAYQRPLTAPLKPLPCPCGECGSPSWSVNAWCLRWSATHEMTGPCTATEPRIAQAYCTGLYVANDRCVSMRWKPTVTPSPVATYMTSISARSLQSTSVFQSSTIATRTASSGTSTPARLEIRCAVVMACGLPP